MPRKTTPEGAVTKAVRDLLRHMGVFHWKQHQGLGSAPGVADIIGCYDGRLLAIELKAPGKRIKPDSAQQRFLDNVHEHGGIAIEADSVEALVAGFGKYGYKLPVLF